MLLFISKDSWAVHQLILDFKTSYVIVYRLCKCMGVTKQNNFKTSYVIVYLNSANHDSNQYRISKHLMLLFILHFHYLSDIFIYFKTSYVIVYLLTFACNLCSFIFQNILCYCLSITALIDEPIGLIFQNILCYCLSISAVQIVPHS